MHSIKIFVVVVISLLCLLCLVTIFLPSKVTVSRSIVINTSEAGVANEIEAFKNWKDWYPAFQNPSIASVAIRSNDSSFVEITGDDQRKLIMHLVKAGPENINVVLFEEGKNTSYQFILTPLRTGGTRLNWNVNTTLPWYPWKKITGIFLDQITGPQYADILQNLKIAAEKNHAGLPR